MNELAQRFPTFYTVMVDDQRGPKAKHDSLESATAEAKRLLYLNPPGSRAWVLKAVAGFQTSAEPAEIDLED